MFYIPLVCKPIICFASIGHHDCIWLKMTFKMP